MCRGCLANSTFTHREKDGTDESNHTVLRSSGFCVALSVGRLLTVLLEEHGDSVTCWLLFSAEMGCFFPTTCDRCVKSEL